MEHAGHCIIDAFQEGDRDHRPGFGSTVILVVPARQSIEYTVVPTPAVAGTSVTLQAWGGGSGLPVQMSIDASTTNDACSLVYVVNTLVLNKAGTCVVNYDQAGNRDYRPAPRMQQSFEVLPRNEAPVAVASADPTSGVAPLQVSFDGSGSSDADGEIASFDWNFGDGSDPVSGAEVTHTYAEPGIYTATLTVVDDDGLSSTDTVEITVEEAPPLTDSLSVTIRGGLDYDLSAVSTAGDVVIRRDALGVQRVHGQLTLPGVRGGDATFRIDVRRVFLLPFYVGTLRLTDRDAGMPTLEIPVMGSLAPAGDPPAVSATSRWFVFRDLRFRSITVEWSVTDHQQLR